MPWEKRPCSRSEQEPQIHARASSDRTARPYLLNAHHGSTFSTSTSTKSLERDELECAESCLTLYNSHGFSSVGARSGSPVHGILGGKNTGGLIYSLPRDLPTQGLSRVVPAPAGGLFTTPSPGSPVKSFTRQNNPLNWVYSIEAGNADTGGEVVSAGSPEPLSGRAGTRAHPQAPNHTPAPNCALRLTHSPCGSFSFPTHANP